MSEPQVDFDTMGPSHSDFTSFTCTYVCVCVSEYICVCGACFSLQGGSEAQGSRPYTQPGSQGAAELGLTARHPGSTFLSYFWKKITLPSAAVLGPTLVSLPGESHGQRGLAGYSPWGHRESDTAE